MQKPDVRIETEIEASIESVWSIISDFSKWSDWHKNNIKVTTNQGIPILLETEMSGVPLRINLTNVKIIDGSLLEWTGTLPLTSKLLKGVRRFTLSEISEGRCSLSQEEIFYGAISGLIRKKEISSYQERYMHHNENIKRIAESKIQKRKHAEKIPLRFIFSGATSVMRQYE